MTGLRAFAAVAAVVCGVWPLGGCGEDSDPARVPETHANPPGPVPCPRKTPDSPDSREYVPSPGSFDARTLIGMSQAAAEARAQEHRCIVRVAVRNGEGQNLTGDLRLDRVDVYIEDGRVVGVRAG